MKINEVEYNTLSYFASNLDSIPSYSGVYYWVYWPSYIDGQILAEEYVLKLKEYSSNELILESNFQDYRFKLTVKDSHFLDKNGLFGLNEKKTNCLLEFISYNNDNLLNFVCFFKKAAFMKPFYIGKANNLKQRISQHISGESKIKPKIQKSGINHNDIWIGFERVEDSKSDELNLIYEEIIQRIVKPSLSEKAGNSNG